MQKKVKRETDNSSEKSFYLSDDNILQYSSDEANFEVEENNEKMEDCLQPFDIEQEPVSGNSLESVKDDEYDCFSKYLVSKLKKYDAHTASFVQHEISNIIFKADMGEYSQNK